jgi:hypothetical protein
MTNRQDDARGRPQDYIQDQTKRWALFGHDDYDDTHITTDAEIVSHPPFDINVYLNCVRLVRRVDAFLGQSKLKLDAEDRRNIRFYLTKYMACDAIRNAYCPPMSIAAMDADAITEDSLMLRFKRVRRLYRRHGGNDDAGRSPKLSAALNKLLVTEFSPPKKRKSAKAVPA